MAAAPAMATTELVTNGGFETGLTGWSAAYTPTSTTCCYNYAGDGVDVHGGDDVFGAPLGGTASLYGDWDAGAANNDFSKATDFYVRQQLTKLSDVTSATLTFSFNVAGGAYAAYQNGYQGYTEVLKRNVTANFLGADQSLATNLYTYERPLVTDSSAFLVGRHDVTIDVTTAFNALADGSFYLDFGRHIPQYFTGPGYYQLDNVSLSIGDAVAPPPPTTAAPEPASWALMILGLGGVGGLLRQRRRVLA
jgi:hypothetical protein